MSDQAASHTTFDPIHEFEKSRDRWRGNLQSQPIDRFDATIEPLDRLTYCVAYCRSHEGEEGYVELGEALRKVLKSYFHRLREVAADCLLDSLLATAYEEVKELEWALFAAFCTPTPLSQTKAARALLWGIADRWPPLFKPVPRARIRCENRCVYLDNKRIASEQDEDVIAYVEVLASYYPTPLPFEAIKTNSLNLRGANQTRLKEKLPQSLHRLIVRIPGKGHVLYLPDPD